MNSHEKLRLYVNNEDVFQVEFSAVKCVWNNPHFYWLLELWNSPQQEFQWVAIFEEQNTSIKFLPQPFSELLRFKKKFYLLFTNYSCSMFSVSLVSR